MITYIILNVLLTLLSGLTWFLPSVSTLPSILGIDTDALFSSGVASFKTLATDIWLLADIFGAFIVLMSYYVTMFTLRLFRVIR
jgi:hypothetical protein